LEILRRAANRFGTPLYVYSLAEIGENVRRLRRAVGDATAVSYSVKANPCLEVVRFLLGEGFGFDVASAGELELVWGCGACPAEVSFAGPGKTDAQLAAAIKAGVGWIVVESIGELARVETLCRRQAVRCRVAIRVNPSRLPRGARLCTGGGPRPFGIDQERVADLLRSVARWDWVSHVGVHVYAGTQVLEARYVAEHVDSVGAMVVQWACHRVAALLLGPGLGVSPVPHQQSLDLEIVQAAFERLRRALGVAGIELRVESGRFLVASSGHYLASVVDVKTSRGRRFVILDGGTNHHVGAQGAGRFIRSNPRMGILREGPVREWIVADVVGPLCTPSDRIGEGVEVPADVRPGDLLAVANAGAYCRSARPLCFLSHDWPAEIVCRSDGELVCSTRRVSAGEVLRLQTAKADDGRG
jgi:diaminopimelate decarboxylase